MVSLRCFIKTIVKSLVDVWSSFFSDCLVLCCAGFLLGEGSCNPALYRSAMIASMFTRVLLYLGVASCPEGRDLTFCNPVFNSWMILLADWHKLVRCGS